MEHIYQSQDSVDTKSMALGSSQLLAYDLMTALAKICYTVQLHCVDDILIYITIYIYSLKKKPKAGYLNTLKKVLLCKINYIELSTRKI